MREKIFKIALVLPFLALLVSLLSIDKIISVDYQIINRYIYTINYYVVDVISLVCVLIGFILVRIISIFDDYNFRIYIYILLVYIGFYVYSPEYQDYFPSKKMSMLIITIVFPIVYAFVVLTRRVLMDRNK